jgi:prephenate dehydratase
LRGKPWEYLFYIDLIGRAEDTPVKNALSHLGEVCDFLRVLGTYRAAA